MIILIRGLCDVDIPVTSVSRCRHILTMFWNLEVSLEHIFVILRTTSDRRSDIERISGDHFLQRFLNFAYWNGGQEVWS